jgi:Zn-dependent peptidase ImmA (M78 family)
VRRGFKAEAERIGSRIRDEMGKRTAEALDPYEVAEHLGVVIRAADELVDRTRLDRLAAIQPDAWSAATFKTPSGDYVVVVNPLSSPARGKSDLAHELSHIILGHSSARLERLGHLAFFTCDATQEEEANWLGGCLLLPRPMLLKAARQGWSPEQLAQHCTVSVPMARFRLNASGVLIQAGHERKRQEK